MIGGTLLHEGENELLRTRSAYVAIGRDDVVEIAEPLDAGTPIADYVDANHHGLFAVWLQVEDLAGATGYLASKKIAAVPRRRRELPLRSRHHPRRALGRHHRVDPRRHPRRLVAGVARQSPSASAASSARNRWSSRARKCGDT